MEELGLEQALRIVLLSAPLSLELKLKNIRNTEREGEVIYDMSISHNLKKNNALRYNIGLDISLKILILIDI